MNRCIACGEPAPDGYELCWFCRHARFLPKTKPKPAPDSEQQLCSIDADKTHSGLLEDYAP